ncbi:hypothetical protein PanNE5_03370 [Pandoraea sp. NE5]|uniref:DUF1828 domain-containing protein n=1 Tax=Pandoraea sp. NE5 TaxID=2904129 RepID=UPI0021C4449C|nr:DUF1828 domain-containing protein [Pandoraea sp. NE5]BDD90897.1 hypothetical protein PanNE5_03370 [Pandoraea sp. NE5]
MSDLAETIDDVLCAQICGGILKQQTPNGLRLALPMVGRDGDHITLYALSHAGGYRITDHGSTRMRLSYEIELSDLDRSARGKVYEQILRDCAVEQSEQGALYSDVPSNKFAEGLFNTAQAVARILDLPQWNRRRVTDTFLDDLATIIREASDDRKVERDFVYDDLASASSYIVDYRIALPHDRDFLIFGVDSSNKARLSTITLQHLRSVGKKFDSLVVVSSLDDVPKADLGRLMNAANDMVAGVDDRSEIHWKVRHRLAAA